MVKNYLKTAVRSLFNNKVYAIVNTLGLAIGLGCFILVVAFLQKELGYENSFEDADRIYRVTTYLDVNGTPNHYPLTHFPAPEDMMNEYPEIDKCLRMYTPTLFGGNPPKIRHGELSFSESRFFIADSNFFEFFEYSFKYGNSTALSEPYSVVLTEETSQKYFGSINPVGKTIQYNDSISLQVTGVLNRVTFYTHLQFDFLANARDIIRQSIPSDIDLENAYVGMWYYGYIRLKDGADVQDLQSKLGGFSERHYTQRYKDNNGRLELQRVTDIHLRSSDMVAGDISAPGNITYVYVLSIVGISVLIVACFNFVNLSTARYLSRSKEVGIRKSVGAERAQLISQFIGEAMLVTFLAGLASVVIVILFLPTFNLLANTNLAVAEVFSVTGVLQIILLFFIVGVAAGIYPAVILSGIKPAVVLKRSTTGTASGVDIRKALVVLQFSVSLVLIIGTFIVMTQLDYLRSRDMGFDKEQIVVITDPGIPTAQLFPVLKEKLLKSSSVLTVTSLSHDLGQKNLPFSPIKREGKDEEVMLPVLFAGFDFLETFNLKMKQGRFFDINVRGDSSLSFVINESAAKSFNWTDSQNRKLTFGASPSPDQRVIGVIEDFNFDPLRNKVSPLVIKFGGFFANLAIKLKAGDHQRHIAEIETLWKEVYPDAPCNFYFLDEAIDSAYGEEQKLSRIYSLFCGLSIFIACLGLIALTSYSIEKRKKEIALRKVLGSSSVKITLLIYREFLTLITIAFIIAAPTSFFIFGSWLEKFAYHTTIEPWIFGVSLLLILAISAASIVFQTVKASQINPATTLRNE